MSDQPSPQLRTRVTLTKVDVSGDIPRVIEEIVIEDGRRVDPREDA